MSDRAAQVPSPVWSAARAVRTAEKWRRGSITRNENTIEALENSPSNGLIIFVEIAI
jgi:hypothetical protein